MRAWFSIAGVTVTVAACAPMPVMPSGAETFAAHCASCHGARAEGDGPVAATMNINVPNLRTLSQRNNGRFPTEEVASYIDGRSLPAAHGDRNMPVWGPVFDTTGRLISGAEGAEQRIDAVIDFLREVQLASE
jgi:mono/diheme cytochrome c family protein